MWPLSEACVTKHTVMVVEDFDDIRAMMRMLLQTKGCSVIEAANGKEAVEVAARHSDELDLILMDLRMPVMTGVEATRRIHEQTETRHIPIVAMSAHCEGNWKKDALDAGANECVSKPVDFGLLDEIINRYALRH